MKIKYSFRSAALASALAFVSSQAFASVTTFDFNMPGLGTGDVYGDQNVANQWSNPVGELATAPNVSFAGYSGIQGNGSAFGFPTSPILTDTATAFIQYYAGSPTAAPGSITLLDNIDAPTLALTFSEVNRPGYGGTLTFEVLEGSTVLATYTGTSSWTTYTLLFTPVQGEDISFQALSNVGGIDSSVAITGVSISTVPELSTWVMMLAGFAGLGFFGYRRNHSASRLV